MGRLIFLVASIILSLPLSANTEKLLIPLNQSFGDTAQKESVEQMSRSAKTELHTVEKGLKNNIAYRFYHTDGSGTFAGDKENDISYLRTDKENWSLGCKQDLMDDEVFCHARRGDFLIYYSKKTGYLVDLSGDKYPHSSISVRVNDGAVFSASESSGFDREQSKNILSLIEDGDMVATRYVSWPYRLNVDKRSAYYGLPVVLDYMKWVVEVAQ